MQTKSKISNFIWSISDGWFCRSLFDKMRITLIRHKSPILKKENNWKVKLSLLKIWSTSSNAYKKTNKYGHFYYPIGAPFVEAKPAKLSDSLLKIHAEAPAWTYEQGQDPADNVEGRDDFPMVVIKYSIREENVQVDALVAHPHKATHLTVLEQHCDNRTNCRLYK